MMIGNATVELSTPTERKLRDGLCKVESNRRTQVDTPITAVNCVAKPDSCSTPEINGPMPALEPGRAGATARPSRLATSAATPTTIRSKRVAMVRAEDVVRPAGVTPAGVTAAGTTPVRSLDTSGLAVSALVSMGTTVSMGSAGLGFMGGQASGLLAPGAWPGIVSLLRRR